MPLAYRPKSEGWDRILLFEGLCRIGDAMAVQGIWVRSNFWRIAKLLVRPGDFVEKGFKLLLS